MNKKYIIIIAFLILQNEIQSSAGWWQKTKAHLSTNKKKYIAGLTAGLAAIGAGLYYKDAIANVLSNYFGSQKTVPVKTYQSDDEAKEVRSFLSQTDSEENKPINQLNLSANQISGGKQIDDEEESEYEKDIKKRIETQQKVWESTDPDELQQKLKNMRVEKRKMTAKINKMMTDFNNSNEPEVIREQALWDHYWDHYLAKGRDSNGVIEKNLKEGNIDQDILNDLYDKERLTYLKNNVSDDDYQLLSKEEDSKNEWHASIKALKDTKRRKTADLRKQKDELNDEENFAEKLYDHINKKNENKKIR